MMELMIISLITTASVNQGVDPTLALALAFTESGFKNITTPNDGKSASYGAMQVKAAAARDVGYTDKDLQDLTKSIYIGVKYLKHSINKCHGISSGLSAYNSGKCKATSKYSQKVLKNYKLIQKGMLQ